MYLNLYTLKKKEEEYTIITEKLLKLNYIKKEKPLYHDIKLLF